MYTTLISTGELSEHLTDPDWVVVDCRFSLADTSRGRDDYAVSHIAGAVYAHLDDDLSGDIIPGQTGRHPLPDPETFARLLGTWGIAAGTQVVAYDDFGGGIAARLWWMLRWLGHEAVAVLDGGWPAWKGEGRATASGRETKPTREFVPNPQVDMILTAGEVESIRLDPDYCLIDARAAERYRGETEPIDPVAGHIPGAVNLPWPANIDAGGRFLPKEALRARYQPLIQDYPPQRIVCYCGSGVTACHTLLAMAYVDLGHARMYAGSWSEWITDSDRAIATVPIS
ncbi:MAG: sulfurtransferase [Chloroflexi bacterium]|nr:sulfurtransferase [Chloroflexota bacterium]